MDSPDLSALIAKLADEAEAVLPDGVGYVLVLTTVDTGDLIYGSNIEDVDLGEMLEGLGERIGDEAAFAEAEREQKVVLS